MSQIAFSPFWLAETPAAKFGAEGPLGGNPTKGRHENHLCAQRDLPSCTKCRIIVPAPSYRLYLAYLALLYYILKACWLECQTDT